MREKLAEFFELVYDFRQFITFAALLLVAVVFRCVNFINGSEFVDLMKNVTVALFAVHGMNNLIAFGKDYVNSKLLNVSDRDKEEPPHA